jgi:hypothetical protein
MPARVLINGYGVGQLVAALECRASGYCVDIVFDGETIPSNAHVANRPTQSTTEEVCNVFMDLFIHLHVCVCLCEEVWLRVILRCD